MMLICKMMVKKSFQERKFIFNLEGDSDEDFKFKGRRSAGGRKLHPSRRSSVRSTRLSNDNQRSRLKPSIDDDYEAYEPQHECHICGHVSVDKSQ